MSTICVFMIILAVLCLALPASAANVVWLEAERFDNHGGWTSDTQFIDQMGSPYLMAIGLGEPVEDAVTEVSVPAEGTYRLWARTKDWVPEHHPGRFQIMVNGEPVERTFGESGQIGWQWEDGGKHRLSGEAELRLHDLTGFYSRCDALILTDDPAWTPPADKREIATLREHYGGVSREVQEVGPWDVVVVGGGLAGCMAAVSAARMGARTALIQNRPMLGGNASREILVPPVGVWPHKERDPLDPRETGLIEEVRTEGNQRTEEAVVYAGRLERLLRAEPDLDLFLSTHATGVEKSVDDTIGAVLAVQPDDGQRLRFAGRLFIDCTGDGAIGAAAGAEHRHGREPRSLYNEPQAPEVGDRQTMGNSLKYVSQATDSEQPYEPPLWARRFESCDDFTPGRHPRLGGSVEWQWMIELGGTRNTVDDAEEIRDDLLQLIYGIWDHVKNHCDQHRERAKNHRLVWVAHVAGKRESRRLIGDYVLTGNDLINQMLFPDRVAYGGWSLDDHHPEGFFFDGPPVPLKNQYLGHRYSIPYRSLYSKNIGNLLMAGRDISASHIALSDTRVMLTCAVIGQASGTAAGLCIEHGTTPRGVYEEHLVALQQQLLKDGAHIIGLPNLDPRDLARSASITASSQKSAAANVNNGLARGRTGEANAWEPDADDESPWIQLEWDAPHTFNTVHVTFLTKDHAPEQFVIEARQDDEWRELATTTDNRRRRCVIGLERTTTAKLRVAMEPVEGRRVGLCEIRVYDEPERLIEIARRVAANRNVPDDEPDLPWLGGIDPKTLDGIVLDSSQAKRTGQWVHSTWSGEYVLHGYLHDGNASKGGKSLTFSPNLAEAGEYEVHLAYSAMENRATNVPITINTSRGSTVVYVNQRVPPTDGGLFRRVGRHYLDAGDGTSIVISNEDTDGYVVVDAVQLVR